MRWLFILLCPFWGQAQILKPGLYRDLHLEKPLVLDTGSYTFTNLKMSQIKGVGLDGRKARSIKLLQCRFEGNGQGTGVLASGNLVAEKSLFNTLFVAIQHSSNQHQGIRLAHNTFTDNRTAISLQRLGSSGTTTLDFTLKCNQFKLTCAEQSATACDNEPLRKGLVIGEGVRVIAPNNAGDIDNAIGGINTFNTAGDAYPNANEWPVEFGTDRSVFPSGAIGNIQIGWSSPANWQSLENNSNNPSVIYRRYKNEFVQNNAVDEPPFFTSLANANGTWVKTDGTTNLIQGVTYEDACQGLIDDPDPIFPARISVASDSQSVTSLGFTSFKAGPWLGEAVPNPAQRKTLVQAFVPPSEELAVLQFVELASGKVLSSKMLSERGKLDIEIDLTHFAAGVYGYQVVLKDRKLGAKRFVVIK